MNRGRRSSTRGADKIHGIFQVSSCVPPDVRRNSMNSRIGGQRKAPTIEEYDKQVYNVRASRIYERSMSPLYPEALPTTKNESRKGGTKKEGDHGQVIY